MYLLTVNGVPREAINVDWLSEKQAIEWNERYSSEGRIGLHSLSCHNEMGPGFERTTDPRILARLMRQAMEPFGTVRNERKKMKVTTDQIMSFNPCPGWPRERVSAAVDAAGGDLVTLLRSIVLDDALWLILREEFIPAPALHELACRYAEDVLHLWEAKYPNDKRPREAIEAKRAWLRGEISDQDLDAAKVDAYSASYAWCTSHARSAARSASGSAVRLSPRVAAYSASYYSARSAAMDDDRAAAKYLEWAIADIKEK